jgi:signal transduction histidine kinase/ligand-binding sensor domain-containing protein
MRRGAEDGEIDTRPVAGIRGCALAAILLAVLAPRCLAGGTPADYLIDFWDAESGLPGNSVTVAAQTPEGYLWLGTYDGLVRFDGIRFVTFDSLNTPALRHARVDRLAVDAAGVLWINTHDGSLVSLRQGVFSREWDGRSSLDPGVWLVSSREDEQLFYLQTGVILRRELHAGRVGAWQTIRPPGTTLTPAYCVSGSGVTWIASSDGRLWRLVGGRPEPVPTRDDLDGRQIQVLTTDPDGRVWVGTEREIAAWSGAHFQRMTPQNGEAHINVTFFRFSRDGSYWVAANGRLRKGIGRRWVFELKSARHLASAVPATLTAQEDRDGGIWFAHDGRGLLHMRREGVVRRFGFADGFASDRVKCLLEDREGDVWVSVDRGGLARLRERRFRLASASGVSPDHAAVSVSADRRGSVWFGTLGQGLGCLRSGASDRFRLPAPASRQFVFSVFPDDNNRLWMSADFEDLWLFEQGRARRAPWPVHGLKALLVDRAGRVWMGRKDGLSCLERGQLRAFRQEDGFHATDVRALAEDGQGAIWIGCGDGAIYRYQGGALERLHGLEMGGSYPIWSLVADHDGTVWAGTHGGGLLRLSGGRVTRHTTRDGLMSDVICQLIDDDHGYLWLGSRAGVLRIPKSSLSSSVPRTQPMLPSLSYGHSDGLPPLECSGYQPSASRDREGRLWFATTKGVVSVMPRDLRENRVAPTVVIEEVRVDGELQSGSNVLVVPAGRRNVELRYTGLSLAAPDKVRFRYRLEGLDRAWVDAGMSRTARYSHLAPREYRFHVIACNSDGVWNEQGAALVLRVLPHYWETWWFRSLVGLLVLGVTAGSVRHLATRRLRREMARLERQRAIESDRARIAKDIHDDLGAGLTQISLLGELVRSDRPQEAEAHLEQISETACELTRAMDEIVWAVDPANDTLESLWGYLSQFTQDYLGLAKIDCRLDTPDQIPAVPLTSEIRHNVFLAAKEALTNAVKHSGAHALWLRLEAHGQPFSLVIQDDGQGFDSACAAGPSGSASGAAGHGLRNMKERMAALGGSCVVHSAPGHGTRVELSVAPR